MSHTDIENEGFKALQEYVASCTVAITSTKKEFENGSGVAVSYANQDYILTAEHVLKQEADNDNILVIGRPAAPLIDVQKDRLADAALTGSHGQPTYATATRCDIEARVIGAPEEEDSIAALRVQNTAECLPNTAFHKLTDQGETEIEPGQFVNILGFPIELAKEVKSKMTRPSPLPVFPHLEQRKIRPNSDWPKYLKPLDPKVYFITDYTKNEETCDPVGMSGCGLWSIPRLKDGMLWSPNQSRLLGIQIAYHRSTQLLLAVRIDQILDKLKERRHG